MAWNISSSLRLCAAAWLLTACESGGSGTSDAVTDVPSFGGTVPQVTGVAPNGSISGTASGSFGSPTAPGGGGGAVIATPSGGAVVGTASGEVGVTPGGAQDIAFARAQIAAHLIPPASAITVEGLLSEHDLPAGGPACNEYLCLRPSLGVVPKLDGSKEHWLMLGMASGQKTPFEAPPLDVVVLVDKSAGMAVDMKQTMHAVTTLVDRLRDEDRLAVLTFDSSVHTLQAAGAIGDRAALNAQLSAVRAGGGADLMAGLKAAYAAADGFQSSPSRIRRVVVLSCGYPGSTTDYTSVVEQGATRGIGLTFIGVLLGFHATLADAMSQAHGGNYYFTNSLERTETIVDDEFDFMMTPLAYDFALQLDLTSGYTLERVFGLPGDQVGAARSELKVATLFPSKRHGALLVKLRAVQGQASSDLGTAALSYRPEPALGFSGSSAARVALTSSGDPNQPRYDSTGVRKAIALVQEADGMRKAIELARTNASQAAQDLAQLAAFLEAEAKALDDAPLRAEAGLVNELRALIAK